MKKFALIGAAGYVAPRHMKVIADTGNELVAALDPNDSVGIIDKFFPNADFFTEHERFDRYIDKLRNSPRAVSYISITSPNYLHDSHIRFSLRSGAHAICEKPLVLNPHNIAPLIEIERETNLRVFSILQLRLHPSIVALKNKINVSKKTTKYDVDLTYITSRGRWYNQSWKGQVAKSGGIATNIGIHFFDMLHYIFGQLQDTKVHLNSADRAGGFLEFEHARVRWFLSINSDDICVLDNPKNSRTFREILINGENVEFTEGFDDLHTASYQHILSGNGFGLLENLAAIDAVTKIRNSPTVSKGEFHELTSRFYA